MSFSARRNAGWTVMVRRNGDHNPPTNGSFFYPNIFLPFYGQISHFTYLEHIPSPPDCFHIVPVVGWHPKRGEIRKSCREITAVQFLARDILLYSIARRVGRL